MGLTNPKTTPTTITFLWEGGTRTKSENTTGPTVRPIKDTSLTEDGPTSDLTIPGVTRIVSERRTKVQLSETKVGVEVSWASKSRKDRHSVLPRTENDRSGKRPPSKVVRDATGDE